MVHPDFNPTNPICHYSKLSLWSRRENERERERERREGEKDRLPVRI